MVDRRMREWGGVCCNNHAPTEAFVNFAVRGAHPTCTRTFIDIIMSLSSSRSRTGRPSSRSKSRGGRRETQDDLSLENEVPQLAWQLVSREKLAQLESLAVKEVARELAEVLSLACYEENLKDAAVLDYYVAGYWFAKENKFSDEQMSAFLTLLHSLLNNLKEKQLSLVDNVRELQQHMTGVAVSDHTSLRCLTKETAQLIVEYIAGSLFQHYHLFECLFAEEQQEEQISCHADVSLPPSIDSLQPAPLEEAVTESFYHRLLAPPPSTSTETMVSSGTDTEHSGDINESGGMLASCIQVTPEEVKSMMTTMAAEAFSSYQEQLSLKLKTREESYTSKLSKVGNK